MRVTNCPAFLGFLGGGTVVGKPGKGIGRPPSVAPLQSQLCPYLMTWFYDLEHQRLMLLRSPEMGPEEWVVQPVIIS